MYTLLYLKWIANTDLLDSTRNSAQCGSLDGRWIWGRMDTCLSIAESLQLFTWNYHTIVNPLSVQNKKFFFFFLKKQGLKLDSVVTDVGMLFCSPGDSAGPSHPVMLSKTSGICRELLKLFVSLADSCPFYSLSEQLPNYILNPHLSFYWALKNFFKIWVEFNLLCYRNVILQHISALIIVWFEVPAG